jgi:putative glutamine amidotransferase
MTVTRPMKPLIGVTSSPRESEYPNQPLDDSAPTAYGEVITAAGGIPVILPVYLDLDGDLFDRLDGIVVTGGGDVDPALYGRPVGSKTAGIDQRRDAFEIGLVRRAAERDVPLMAICRGIQAMNVALGGTLIQDVTSDVPGALRHMDEDHPASGSHAVRIDPGSPLADMMGGPEPIVNSLHHQAVEEPGPDLRAVARAPDGLIEAIELPDHRFFYGVQWHPELLGTSDPTFGMFRSFVEASQPEG